MLQQWIFLLILKVDEAGDAPLLPLGRSGRRERGIEDVERKSSPSEESKEGSVREEGSFAATVPSTSTAAPTPRTIPITVSPNLVVSPSITPTVAPIVVSVTHPPLWLRPNSQNSA